MNIGNYRLTSIEENSILTIYETLKCAFPYIQIQHRKEIIGIGEEGRHLLCYFLLNDDAIFVKFKNRTPLNLNDSDAIQKDIDATIELFRNEEFKIKTKSSVLNEEMHVSSEMHNTEYGYMHEAFLLYASAIESIPKSKVNTCFDSCSNRLKNALYRNHICTVQDLLVLTPEQIMNIPNLGRKCFNELCNFLLSLSNGKLLTQNNEPHPLTEASKRLQKLTFINDNRQETVIKIEDAFLDLDKNDEAYNRLYLDLANHIYESATKRLQPRECAILLSRFGINEQAKTLQEIGDVYSITRERVRQIMLKATRKLNYKKTSTDNFLDLEYRKAQIVSQISEVSAAGFLSFLFLQEANIWLIKFICKVYFHSEIDVAKFKQLLDEELSQKKQAYAHLEKTRIHNENINRLICFPDKRRCITDEDFSRLKTERLVSSDEEELKNFQFNEQSYQCESYLEQRILQKFLVNGTFKSIKTQSLKIPFKDYFYHPDFQCLTHDNHLVLVEIKPLLRMGVCTNIEKFEALKEYCNKYGFGYLIIDERGNSFEDVDAENAEFSKSVLTEIHQHGSIAYERYRQIYLQTNASVKNLITLIKKHNLHYSFPFCLRY